MTARLSFWVVLALIGMLLARVFWAFAQPESSILPLPQIKLAASVQPATGGQQILEAIAGLKHFDPWETGRPVTADNNAAAKKLVAVPSDLDLLLVGTFILPNRQWAVLTHKKTPNKQITLQPGDEIDGAILDRIERHAVYFKRNGKYEIISMAVEFASNKVTGEKGSRPARAFSGPQIGLDVPATRIKELMKQGIKSLKGVNIVPFYDGAKSLGYQLKFPPGRDKLREFGIVSGDVISKINGISVENSAAIVKMAHHLDRLGSIDLELLRNGAARRIHLTIKQ